MSKVWYLGYNRRYRLFCLAVDKIMNIGNRSVSVRVHVMESFGCPFSICNFDGVCKDCPNKICTQLTY